MLPDLQSQWSQAFGQIFTSLLGEVLGGMLEVILFDIDIKWYWYHTKSYLFRGMLVFSVLFFVTNWSYVGGCWWRGCFVVFVVYRWFMGPVVPPRSQADHVYHHHLLSQHLR